VLAAAGVDEAGAGAGPAEGGTDQRVDDAGITLTTREVVTTRIDHLDADTEHSSATSRLDLPCGKGARKRLHFFLLMGFPPSNQN
jgi:hypothetical protein